MKLSWLWNILECRFTVQYNQIKNNTAKKNGGGIYYDLYSPIGLL